MSHILVIADAKASRRWEFELLSRLQALGHVVSVRHGTISESKSRVLDYILAIESRRFGASLASRSAPLSAIEARIPDLVIDLTDSAGKQVKPVLTLELQGQRDVAMGIGEMLAHRQLPELITRLDGVAIGVARPMMSDRLWLSRGLNEVLAGAISLMVQGVTRFFADRIEPLADVAVPAAPVSGFLRHYLRHIACAVAERVVRKLRKRAIYWQVAYRLIDGPDIAETGRLDGAAFTVLPDDGLRFYADPFVIEHNGGSFLFVEEYPYATGRGVISVAELGADGRFGALRVVLEEPHHLSYPQVFAENGEMFMIPESSAARDVVLYRAEAFPDRWRRDCVLIADRDLNDMTLLVAHGRYWLIGTERFGYGSASDTMVVYSAPALRGPWAPHPLNLIKVDRAGARPGGAFIARDGKIFLPVQDGSHAYGGGLGLMELQRLDDGDVRFREPVPIGRGPAWDRAGIHTLNRAGRLEVIDSSG